MQYDYNFLCRELCNLFGVETRVFYEGKLLARCAHFDFNPDVFGVISSKLDEQEGNVYYIETDELLIFGIVKCPDDKVTVILGPTFRTRPTRDVCVTLLFSLGQAIERMADLQEYFANISPHPFETFLGVLSFVNYMLNKDKVLVQDMISKNTADAYGLRNFEKENIRMPVYDDLPRNTYMMERQMLSFISTGNVEAIERMINSPPTGRAGTFAQSELRQRKNLVVCTATLMSRAAIDGGLPSDEAFAISDMYIQKAELMKNGSDLSMLNAKMAMDYTKRVEGIKCGQDNSRFARLIMRYILNNIDKKLTTAAIAYEMKMNRSHMCTRFKSETGQTMGHFITNAKIDEAKRLIRTTTLSNLHISDYLCFSSQSYFQTVFKKANGCTPTEYRERIN